MKKIRMLSVALLFANLLNSQSIIEPLTTSTAALTSAQLATYNKILSHNIYSDIHFVSVNISDQTMYSDGTIKFSLPYLPSYIPLNIDFKLQKFEYTDGDNMHVGGAHNHYPQSESDTLYGHSNFLITKVDGKYTGHFSLEKESYELYDLTDGIQVLCHTDLNMSEGQHDCATIGVPSFPLPESSPSECRDRRIKILFLYTPEAELVESDLQGKAAQCINDLNTIWSQSGLTNFIFENVGMDKIQYSETNSIVNDINAMRGMAFTTNKRAQTRAEIVVFLTNGNYSNLPPSLQLPRAFGIAGALGTNFANAFALVEVIHATSGRHTFAHEVSHLFDARHDTDPTQNNTHGHIFNTGTWGANWGGIQRKTLMCELQSGASRIQHVSNPTVKFMNVPTGTPYHNNAQEGIDYFIDPIASFFNDVNNPVTSVDRVDCGQWKDYWMAKVTGFCPTPDAGPYTYKWDYLNLNQVFTWAFTGVPQAWTPLTTGNAIWLHLPNPYNYVRCEIRNGINQLVHTGFKFIYGIDANGNCTTYRPEGENLTSIANALVKNDSQDLLAIPNPNNGSFNLKLNRKIDAANTRIVIYDQIGREVGSDNYSINFEKDGEIKIIIKTTLSNGLYQLSLKDNSEFNKKCRIFINR